MNTFYSSFIDVTIIHQPPLLFFFHFALSVLGPISQHQHRPGVFPRQQHWFMFMFGSLSMVLESLAFYRLLFLCFGFALLCSCF